MKTRKRIAVIAAAIAVCGLAVFLIVSRPDGAGFSFSPSQAQHAEGMESPGGTGVHVSAGETPAASEDDLRGQKDRSIHFGTYAGFLNSLSRKLTRAEEDEILANSQRDPQVLLRLALAGSARADQFLREALEKDPENPLVHYAILHRVDPEVDRLASAQKLVSLLPHDGELWYAAAAAALEAGNRALAADYLQKGAAQSDFASLHRAELAARIEAYQWAGSTEEMARTRALLESHQSIGDVALVKLQQYLLTEDLDFAGPFEMTQGKEEMAALVLRGLQKEASAPGLSLDSYYGTRSMEIEVLRSFFQANVTGGNAAAAQYLSAPAAELFATANTAFEDLFPVLMFSYDKPGIYQRLSGDQQQELIARIQQDGEIAAFSWAHEERPDIFRSSDFKPQGYSKENWTGYLQRFGNPPGASRK